MDWAAQEFAALVASPGRRRAVDPWRRTSGIHKVHDRRPLAIVRELWDAAGRDRGAARPRPAPGAARRRHRAGRHRAARTTGPIWSRCRCSADAAQRRQAAHLAGGDRRGAWRSRRPGPAARRACPTTGRRRPAAGRPRTRRPPPGWPRPEQASPRCPTQWSDPGGEPDLPGSGSPGLWHPTGGDEVDALLAPAAPGRGRWNWSAGAASALAAPSGRASEVTGE